MGEVASNISLMDYHENLRFYRHDRNITTSIIVSITKKASLMITFSFGKGG